MKTIRIALVIVLAFGLGACATLPFNNPKSAAHPADAAEKPSAWREAATGLTVGVLGGGAIGAAIGGAIGAIAGAPFGPPGMAAGAAAGAAAIGGTGAVLGGAAGAIKAYNEAKSEASRQ